MAEPVLRCVNTIIISVPHCGHVFLRTPARADARLAPKGFQVTHTRSAAWPGAACAEIGRKVRGASTALTAASPGVAGSWKVFEEFAITYFACPNNSWYASKAGPRSKKPSATAIAIWGAARRTYVICKSTRASRRGRAREEQTSVTAWRAAAGLLPPLSRSACPTPGVRARVFLSSSAESPAMPSSGLTNATARTPRSTSRPHSAGDIYLPSGRQCAADDDPHCPELHRRPPARWNHGTDVTRHPGATKQRGVIPDQSRCTDALGPGKPALFAGRAGPRAAARTTAALMTDGARPLGGRQARRMIRGHAPEVWIAGHWQAAKALLRASPLGLDRTPPRFLRPMRRAADAAWLFSPPRTTVHARRPPRASDMRRPLSKPQVPESGDRPAVALPQQ